MTQEIKITDKNCDFQVIALSLTSNPDASVGQCLDAVLDLIPTLRSNLKICEKNDKGVFRCELSKYAFTTPKERNVAKPPAKPFFKSHQPTTTSNCYASIAPDDEEDTDQDKVLSYVKDDLLYSEVSLHNKPSFTLEQHSASSISNDTKPANIAKEISMEADGKKPAKQTTIDTFAAKTSNNESSTSPFATFCSKTMNVLRNAAYKTRDFVHDKDFQTILQNNPILKSVRPTPTSMDQDINQHDTISFHAPTDYHDTDNDNEFVTATNEEVIRDIKILRKERGKVQNKITEMRKLINKFDGTKFNTIVTKLNSSYDKFVDDVNIKSATAVSDTNISMNNDLQSMKMKFLHGVQNDMMTLKNQYTADMNHQMKLHQDELLKQTKTHKLELENLKLRHQSDLCALYNQLQNQRPSTYASATTGIAHPQPQQVPSANQNTTIPTTFGPTPLHSGTGSALNPIQFLIDQKITFEHQGDLTYNNYK